MSMKNGNLISIIMPTYNRGYIIEKAIQSVINQTYKNWELIVVDDASEDNTENIVKAIKDSRIVYLRNDYNCGANYSRNLGCKLAKGEFFAFLDSDNFWENEKLELQLKLLIESASNVALVYSEMELKNGDITTIIPQKKYTSYELRQILCKRNVIDNNTVLIKRSCFEKVGGFDPNMPRLQDWELYFRILVINKYEAIYLERILDYNILQIDSISKDDRKYIDASCLFLEKHRKALNFEDVMNRVCTLMYREINNYDKLRLMKIVDDSKTDDITHIWLDVLYTHIQYYKMLLCWKEKMEKNIKRTIFSKYINMPQKEIAIYGLGRWGELVYDEMKRQGIKITYGIDQNKKEFHDLIIVRPYNIPDDVDLIIVSIFQQFENVYETLKQNFEGEIVSIKDIIFE